MALEVYSNPEDFLRITRSFLMRNEAENNLLLGVLAAAVSGSYQGKLPFMALYSEGCELDLVMMCTPPYPVVFAYQETLPERHILEKVLLDLSEVLGAEFTGITGNTHLSAKLVGLWQEISGTPSRVTTHMRIYRLDHVIRVEDVPGEMRPIEQDDRKLLQSWLAGYTREALNEQPDQDRIERMTERHLSADPELRGLMLWEVDGVPVSMAGYAGPTPNGMRVGMVYTPDDQRRSGYASACTACVSQYVLDRGFEFCFLYTDRLNPTTNHIYQKIGYHPICDVDRYDFVKS